MKKIMTKIGKTIAFLMILVTVLAGVNAILIPKTYINNATWPSTSKFNQFYEMDKNSVDVLFIGSSVAANAFSPQEIYDSYGIRSYNLASQQQSVFFNYYWLKEALKTQSPKVVVMDSKFLFTLHPENPVNTTEGIGREIVDNMHWSKNKIDMINALTDLDDSQSKLSYFLTNIRYHSRWTELDESDFNLSLSEEDLLKGQSVITSYGDDSYTPFAPEDKEIRAKLDPVMEEYFGKIVELCQENNTQLMLVSLPDVMTDAMNNRLIDLAGQYGINYYNFCTVDSYNAIGAQLPKENVVEHENIWGAIKMSRYVASILQSDYGVEAVSDRQWDETSAYYKHLLNIAELQHIENLDEYLAILKSDVDYVTFISVKDDGFRFITDEQVALLNSLGLQAPFKDMFRYSYCGIVDNSNGNIEELSPDEVITINGNILESDAIYEMTSGGGNAGVECGIVINGTNFEINSVGLNIVVYDRLSKDVVDQVCFYTDEHGPYCKRF
ncbi:hypothetical protein CSX00_06215 [Pseudobutyrivibrio ruminis]|uniref:Uncharacterized protein n=1 Tax=Pseudobutyrivibrio ruminis TaxID=46206 RepID=A0A2G3EBB8_9FIRM|nr:hypothetical protein [Pseudobutyrivibrio ruminis]PHU40361.1 hypothetical protein CSX00_06215 [Pseudobutyrivibrio ruminis]